MAGKVLVIKGADFSSVAVEQVTIIDPSAPTYRLTVTSADASMGTVTGGGMYTEGANVNVTATALDGYVFVRWSDGNTSASRTITMGDADLTLTAIFAIQLEVTQNLINYVTTSASNGSTRVIILMGLTNRSSWKCKVKVKDNSPIKANFIRSKNTVAQFQSWNHILSKDPENPGTNYQWNAISEESWVTPSNEREYNNTNTDVETLDMNSILMITTYVDGNTGYPTVAEINQWLEFTFDNVIWVDSED